MTNRQRNELRKAELQGRRDDRLRVEATIIASIAGGMSFRAVANQDGMPSKSQVERIWKAHLADPFNTPDDVRAELTLRFNTLLRSIWPKALGGTEAKPVSAQDQARFVREARLILSEIGQLQPGVYVGKVDVDVSGTVNTERTVRVVHVMESVARIRVAQLADREQPAIAAASTNGHGPTANGSAAA